jgi:hypothetical protein
MRKNMATTMLIRLEKERNKLKSKKRYIAVPG